MKFVGLYQVDYKLFIIVLKKDPGGVFKRALEVVLNTPVFKRVNKGVDQEKKKQDS
ncbi:hypothetical protein J7W08_06485 [Methanococcoides orientis]|uniref:hypothetical protein n=1 Tax=Methanococcoides orientis TaxID=2822137 RepID=UPI001E43B7A2|nr:hypothetical protein [Methanococcoides orientis]UGV39781.1 hypothetical protein J7W08_06485 [Methanococcoides orientis]